MLFININDWDKRKKNWIIREKKEQKKIILKNRIVFFCFENWFLGIRGILMQLIQWIKEKR